MKLMTRVKATMVALALVAAFGVWAFGNGVGTRVGQDDNYVLSVKWSPHALPGTTFVRIVVSVDGHALPPWTRRLSPWGETMTAEKGATIRLTATSHYENTQLLDCIIMRNGKSIPSTGFDSRDTPGKVDCTA